MCVVVWGTEASLGASIWIRREDLNRFSEGSVAPEYTTENADADAARALFRIEGGNSDISTVPRRYLFLMFSKKASEKGSGVEFGSRQGSVMPGP